MEVVVSTFGLSQYSTQNVHTCTYVHLLYYILMRPALCSSVTLIYECKVGFYGLLAKCIRMYVQYVCTYNYVYRGQIQASYADT